MWNDLASYAAFNFKASSKKAKGKHEVLFPVSDVQEPDAADTLAVNVNEMKTILKPGIMAADMTINLTIDDQVTPGAILVMKLTSDGTARTVTFGTGLEGDALAGSVSTTKYVSFIYDGSNFIPMSALTVDNA